MGTELDFIGKKFGRLLVECADKQKNSRGDNIIVYQCLCECGNRKVIARSSLKSGLTNSCGCLKKELARKTHTTHNMSSSREYRIWSGMIKRCTNKNSKAYKNYGGRGITVDPSWLKFENFYNDMGKAPLDYSIERIDVNKGYYKKNCKWIPSIDQGRNKRNSVIITQEGQSLLAVDWEKITGIPRRCIHDRIQKGWSVEDALTIKAEDGHSFIKGFEYKGRVVTFAQLEKEKGYSDSTITKRLKSGWSLEEAIETPLKITLFEFRGEAKTLRQWAQEYGINVDTVRQRMNNSGWSLEKALTTPSNKNRGKLITYKNKTLNLKEWAELIGINNETLSKYLKKGATIEEVIRRFTNKEI